MEITTQEYQKLDLRNIMYDLTMAGAKPTWSVEYREMEEKRVMEPFRRGDPVNITKDDVINLFDYEERHFREIVYEFAHGIINGKVKGTDEEDLDPAGINSYRDLLPTYFNLWKEKRDLLRIANDDSNPELLSDALLSKAETCFARANSRRLGSLKKGYQDSHHRPDRKGSWMTDLWIETLGERAHLEMGWNFVAAAELYTDIMKVNTGLNFPLENNRKNYHR